MSLVINAQAVLGVLVGGLWIPVRPSSFSLDAYEYVEDDDDDSFTLLGGGVDRHTSSTGFTFVVGDGHEFSGQAMAGPIMVVQAVRYSVE